jgi:hypothetical protein
MAARLSSMRSALQTESEKAAAQIAYNIEGLNKFQQFTLAGFLARPIEVYGEDSEVIANLIDAFTAGYRLGKESAGWFANKRISDLHRAYLHFGAKPLPKEWWKLVPKSEEGEQ